MMPTMADVKKPPGIVPGTSLSAIHAQTAATIKKRIKLKIPMMFSYRWVEARLFNEAVGQGFVPNHEIRRSTGRSAAILILLGRGNGIAIT
jgi:hypothetical protein